MIVTTPSAENAFRPPVIGFTLNLSGDVREMRDWVHEFAVNVIRPAAAEWDERDEAPCHLRDRDSECPAT